MMDRPDQAPLLRPPAGWDEFAIHPRVWDQSVVLHAATFQFPEVTYCNMAFTAHAWETDRAGCLARFRAYAIEELKRRATGQEEGMDAMRWTRERPTTQGWYYSREVAGAVDALMDERAKDRSR